jgi:hypothetical protein
MLKSAGVKLPLVVPWCQSQPALVFIPLACMLLAFATAGMLPACNAFRRACC